MSLGGRQVHVTRPWVRSADRAEEIGLSTYQAVASSEFLAKMAMEKILAKISTRRYGAGPEPAGKAVGAKTRSQPVFRPPGSRAQAPGRRSSSRRPYWRLWRAGGARPDSPIIESHVNR